MRDRWRRTRLPDHDRDRVLAEITAEAGWSPRYGFLTLMSAGIAVLGLLLSSPAVIIGAMLVSPLMNPILAFGFALATLDFTVVRRSLLALAGGFALAVGFAALIVVLSPLKEVTSEILSRTRPNLFDLLVALFAALAGAFAVIRGSSGTIVGVAIATALTPPLAVVGYGLATWNPPIFLGALALFGTNFVTIALSATIMASIFGFAGLRSSSQGWIQAGLMALVFIALAAPLGVSLERIAQQTVALNHVRTYMEKAFGPQARVTQLSADFNANPIAVSAVVIAPKPQPDITDRLRDALQRRFRRPVNIQIDQVLVANSPNSLQAQKAEVKAAAAPVSSDEMERDGVARVVALAANVAPDQVLLDPGERRATAQAASIPDATLFTYRALEARAAEAAPGWTVSITPPFQALPEIGFASGSATIDANSRDAIEVSAWAARRWNVSALTVPGYPAGGLAKTKDPPLPQERALAVAAILTKDGVSPTSGAAPARGVGFRLAPASASGGAPTGGAKAKPVSQQIPVGSRPLG